MLLGVMPATACYTARPVTGVAPTGTTIQLDLTDRGRVALGDKIGPSADMIEGVVESANDSGYVIRVSSVRYLSGQTNKWSGESVAVGSALVSRVKERTFSRSLTLVLGLGIAGGLLAAILGATLIGDAAGSDGGTPKTGTGSS